MHFVVQKDAALSLESVAQGLAASAIAYGVQEPVLELLGKSESHDDTGSLKLPTEAFLRSIVAQLMNTYYRTMRLLPAHVDIWLQHHLTAKAIPGLQLTAIQLEELRRLIVAHFQMPPATALHWQIPPETWRSWQALGIIAPGVPLPDVENAYHAGRLFQVLSDGSTYADMLQRATELPRTRHAQLAAEWAQQHAAQYIRDFGERLATRAVRAALTANQAAARGMITAYVEDRLEDAGKPVQNWKALAGTMRAAFVAPENERDWMRVAVSETRMAYNVGRLQAMEEQRVHEIYVYVRTDACDACKTLFLLPDGTPRIFVLAEYLKTVMETGGMNVGRKASRIGHGDGWVPTALVHPWCRCRPMPYVRGMRLGAPLT